MFYGAQSKPQPADGKEFQQPMPPNEFFKLGSEKKLMHVHDMIAIGQLRRRGDRVPGEERVDYSSKFKELNERLKMKPQASHPEGLHRVGSVITGSLGPLLASVRQQEIMQASSVAHRPTAVIAALRLSRSQQRQKESGLESSIASPTKKSCKAGTNAEAATEMTPVDARASATAAVYVSTQGAQDTLDSLTVRRQKFLDFSERLNQCFDDVRAKLVRPNSAPQIITNLRLLRENYDQVRHVEKENEELRMVIQGMAPRKQEIDLQEKIGALEVQISNQVALIKGLREKLKSSSSSGDASRGATGSAAGTTTDSAQDPAAVKEFLAAREVTIVFVDVQSANALRESFPHLIASQFALYHNLLREMGGVHGGYEVGRFGERFEFAFTAPVDACKWAIDVQVKLCGLNWKKELCEHSDTPTELLRYSTTEYLWRGLRVQIGMQFGASALRDALTGGVIFEGPAVNLAFYLEQLAVGGEILLTEDVCRMVGSQISGIALTQHWESLALHPSKVVVYRMVSLAQKERLRFFQRDFAPCEQLVSDNLQATQRVKPPRGAVTLVTVLMWSRTLLEASPESTRSPIVDMFRETIESEQRKENGFISRRTDTQHVIAFSQCSNALSFALNLQTALLSCKWPSEALHLFPTINVQGCIIFNGPRVQIGVHSSAALVDVLDPLTNLPVYQGADSMVSTILANAAPCGAVLVSPVVFAELSQLTEELHYPISEASVEVSIPSSDVLLPTFQLFPASLKVRASFINLDTPIDDSPPQQSSSSGKASSVPRKSETVTALERQIAMLQNRLVEKDGLIRVLQGQIVEKTNVVSRVRAEVLGRQDITIHVEKELRTLDPSLSLTARQSHYIVALAFAHATELLNGWPEDTAKAVSSLNELVNSELALHHGHELRRTASGVSRIYGFLSAQYAAGFWLSIVRKSMDLEWPAKLDDSDGAGVVMALERIPDLHPSLDCIVWKGLRPIAAMDVGVPTFNANCAASTLEALGPAINLVSVLLREAAEGDCILSPAFADELREKPPAGSSIQDFSSYYRLLAADMPLRNRVLRSVFPITGTVDFEPRAEAVTILVVHVSVQNTKLNVEEEFEEDVALFKTTVLKAAHEHDGQVISSSSKEFCFAFVNSTIGTEFAVILHSLLLSAPWSAALLRANEFKEIYQDSKLVMRGIRAHIGAHILENAIATVDLFTGMDVWIHHHLAVPLILARNALAGETILTSSTAKLLAKVQGGNHKIFDDTIGNIIMDVGALPSCIYRAIPLQLKGRVVIWLGEQLIQMDPAAAAQQEAAWRSEQKIRDKLATAIPIEQELISKIERSYNPTDDPIHIKHAKLYRRARELRDNDLLRVRTTEATLAVIETASMIAEDPFYLGTKVGDPSHTHLLLHHLENGEVCTRRNFNRAYAAEIISGQKVSKKKIVPTPTTEDGGGATEDNGSSSAVPRRKSLVSGKASTVKIVPEDVVHLHIAVEHFANIVMLRGLTTTAVEEWVEAMYEQVFGTEGAGKSMPSRLRELGSQTSAIGMEIDDVDMESMRRSIIANLSLVMQRILEKAPASPKSSSTPG